MRVLSGIQPTGRFHWGNYFGAIRQYIELQDAGEAFYFIADLHALTTVREPERLRGFVRDAAIDLVALGLDPERATLFVQSDVPEVAELTWLLMTVTPMGLLERCHAYKDKKARGLTADAGLFTYPVLMAADILAYDADVVPVGEDQVQHIEVCRDLAGTFNHLYGDTIFRLPKPRLVDGAAKVPGTDGQKMSKSYDNYIAFSDSSKNIFGKIMSVSDDAMWEYYKLLLNYDEGGLNELKKLHPMEAKKTLAESLTSLFFDSSVAKKEREEFSKVFSKGKLPDDMPTYSITSLNGEKSSLLNILVSTGEFDSKGSIRRLVKQGGVKVDEQKVEDPEKELKVKDGIDEIIIRAGKKIFIRVIA